MPYTIVGKRNLRKVLEQKARAHPDKTFLIFEDEYENAVSFTYAEFDSMVNRTANGLLSLGVQKGDKINLQLTNCPEFLFAWFAIGKIGAVTVPTNPLSPPDELAYPVRHSESVVSITQPDLLPGIQAIRGTCPDLRHVLVTGPDGPGDGASGFSALVEGQSDTLRPVPLHPLDEAAILYTSGTTSLPKGVLVTHANYIYASEVVSKLTRLGPEDRQLITLPLFHANAQYYSFMTALNVGASVALMPRFSASRFMAQAGRHGCTVTSLFAAPIRMILAQPRTPTEAENGLRMTIFAQNVTAAQLDEWEKRFGAPLLQIYGMTETMGQPLVNPLDYTRDNMSIGMPSLGYVCKVVDENGDEAPDGVPGELLVKGEPGWTVMKGYFKDEENTAKTIEDGWGSDRGRRGGRRGGLLPIRRPRQGHDQARGRERRRRGGRGGHQAAFLRGRRRRDRRSRRDARRVGQGVRHPPGGHDGHRRRDHRLLCRASVQVPGTRARRVPRRVPAHLRRQDPEAHPPSGRGAAKDG